MTAAGALLLLALSASSPTADARDPDVENASIGESPMVQALLAGSASAEIPEDARLYDRLIGAWDVQVRDYADDGTVRESEGEWHFAYALEGRAVQDVWISPPRRDRDAGMPKTGNRYGTTVRWFDPTERRWRIVWINPVSGAFDRLEAHREGREIVQSGRDADGYLMRWVFTDIRTDSARWYAQRSRDDGATWTLEAEFFLRRRE